MPRMSHPVSTCLSRAAAPGRPKPVLSPVLPIVLTLSKEGQGPAAIGVPA